MHIRAVAALFLVLAASSCTGDDGRHHLSSVKLEAGNTLVPAAGTEPIHARPGHLLHNVSATLPPGLELGEGDMKSIYANHKSGGVRVISTSLVTSDADPERLAVTFEMPHGAEPPPVRVGKYEIDFRRNTVTERQ